MLNKRILNCLVMALMILLPVAAVPNERDCPDTAFTIDAFGGEFLVPNYLQLVVNISRDHAVEIRMIRKIDEIGSIKLIAILRNGENFRRVGSSLHLIDEYELNGFYVQVYQSSDPDIGRDIYSIVLERAGDKAHVIVDSLKALDDLLANAENLEEKTDE